MKHLLLSLCSILLFTACVKHPLRGQAYPQNAGLAFQLQIRENAIPCYTLAEGIEIWSDGVACPDKDLLADEIDKMRLRTGMSRGVLRGTKVYLTPFWIQDCGDFITNQPGILGCADIENKVTYVKMRGIYESWLDTFLHELGHIALVSVGHHWGWIHMDSWLLRSFTDNHTTRYLLEDTAWDGEFDLEGFEE